ncbi:hypothetical protein LEMA_P113310.1 [Plenodomus lingam JN3]|uniref:Uncharacterized protein n=1 Tax=Leptosphaeria maculans (strain JN3 / isolate v23.1.3 / race Av1-4-5-6-7-8) TaxID=985895 RepID=E4ZUX9_LEPMJ|nr:hypothetical protein LEMA_P113310.1 [Plenodomus lingam JN3]CBX94916.1 hypothetical protein LEMA_P113310.1 [Plenodomus lingam JN3]
MFSVRDAKEIFQLFPPQNTPDFLPSLILSSGGHGFLTLDFVKARFRSCIQEGYLSTPWLMIWTWIRILFSNSFEPIQLLLYLAPTTAALSDGVIQRSELAEALDVDEKSVDLLLNDVEGGIVLEQGHVFSKTYERKVSDIIAKSLQSPSVDLLPVDIKTQTLPGAPPPWFALHVLRDVLETLSLKHSYLVKENPDGAHCYPKKLLEQDRDAVIHNLGCGQLAYIDLSSFFETFSEFYANIDDAVEHVQIEAHIDLINSFAVSVAKRLNIAKACTQSLAEDGRVNLAHVLEEYPESLRTRILQDITRDINSIYRDEYGASALQVGDFLLASESYEMERRVLIDYAELDATFQWQQLREHPEKEVKYNLVNIAGLITKDPLIEALSKEKIVKKAVEERFWAKISWQETENEAQFAEFWTERVHSRCQVYKEGLDKVSDEKLRDQLLEILVAHVKKELIPEAIARAQSQGLMVSRKTRKNIGAVEDLLKQHDSNLAGILAVLKKFSIKSSIELNDKTVLQAKQSMANDMIRRMQKQKKSDGPVLFLTLVLVLLAKHNEGVVYATGKFAPKLLKQLKTVLSVEQYEQMEKWKEAAKTSSLTAEDRAAMKSMAEA